MRGRPFANWPEGLAVSSASTAARLVLSSCRFSICSSTMHRQPALEPLPRQLEAVSEAPLRSRHDASPASWIRRPARGAMQPGPPCTPAAPCTMSSSSDGTTGPGSGCGIGSGFRLRIRYRTSPSQAYLPSCRPSGISVGAVISVHFTAARRSFAVMSPMLFTISSNVGAGRATGGRCRIKTVD